MELLAFLLFILLVNYFVMKTNKISICVISIIFLPLIPSIGAVWLEMIRNDYSFWFQFLETGYFILSLMSLPAILGLIFYFASIYILSTTFLVIEYFVVRRLRSRAGPILSK